MLQYLHKELIVQSITCCIFRDFKSITNYYFNTQSFFEIHVLPILQVLTVIFYSLSISNFCVAQVEIPILIRYLLPYTTRQLRSAMYIISTVLMRNACQT